MLNRCLIEVGHIRPRLRTRSGAAREGDKAPVRPPTRGRDRVGRTYRTPAYERFLALDAYRVQREVLRYEGTPLRDLFRDLRTRFIRRHTAQRTGWCLDVGSGPGRFSSSIGAPTARVVLIDLSRGMLERARGDQAPFGVSRYDFLRADGLSLPVRPGSVSAVVVLGNLLGLSPDPLPRALEPLARTLVPGGRLIVEIVPGRGEVPVYLRQLPPSALPHALRAPIRQLHDRVAAEGFDPHRGALPSRRSGFVRHRVEELDDALAPTCFRIEAMAVAPLLGFLPEHVTAARQRATDWAKLLVAEERAGRDPARWSHAGALLGAYEKVGRPAGIQGA